MTSLGLYIDVVAATGVIIMFTLQIAVPEVGAAY